MENHEDKMIDSELVKQSGQPERSEQSKMSKNQRKKLEKKLRRQAAKAAAKAERAAKAGNANKSNQNNNSFRKKILMPTNREDMQALRDEDAEQMAKHGFSMYCHNYNPSVNGDTDTWYEQIFSVEELSRFFEDMKNEEEDQRYHRFIIGRVKRIRRPGSKLVFIDVQLQHEKFQLKVNCKTYVDGSTEEERVERFGLFRDVIRVGDICGATGHIGRTKAGELSLYVHKIRLLTPCVRPLPPSTKQIKTEVNGQIIEKEISGLTNTEVRFRSRELDMIVNPPAIERLMIRSMVIMQIHRFMIEKLRLCPVETPILTPSAGGATAKPFVTHSNDYSCDMYLRIAPELYLKRLIVGGFQPGVYEIGRQFRNESNDLTHNSEFTSLEFYLVNATYVELIDITESFLSHIVQNVNNDSLTIDYDGRTIDFTPPYRRLDMIDSLKKYAGINIDDNTDFSSAKVRDYLDSECVRLGVECPEPRTTARLLDKLVGAFVEPLCVNPTFITGHPRIMSPLAKPDRNGTDRTERFELFVNGTELCNAYTELNDPRIQEQNFQSQALAKAGGDDEAMAEDTDFVHSLQYGLPPTGGFGMGIDRLVMLLTNNTSIREVIPFPTMKPGHYDQNFDDVSAVISTTDAPSNI